MNKRIWLYCLLYALIAACSSDEDDGQGTVVFHVAVDSVAAYSVTATITHNGSNRDSYYAYAVEGRVSNVRDEVVRLLDGDRRQAAAGRPRHRVQQDHPWRLWRAGAKA